MKRIHKYLHHCLVVVALLSLPHLPPPNLNLEPKSSLQELCIYGSVESFKYVVSQYHNTVSQYNTISNRDSSCCHTIGNDYYVRFTLRKETVHNHHNT